MRRFSNFRWRQRNVSRLLCNSIKLLWYEGGSLIGVVGFHYPSVIQNEPLKNPQKGTFPPI